VQLDKVNAYVAKKVVDQATSEALEKKTKNDSTQLSSSFNEISSSLSSPQVNPMPISIPGQPASSSPSIPLNISLTRPSSSTANQASLLSHQIQQSNIAQSTTSSVSHDSLMQPQPTMNLNVQQMVSQGNSQHNVIGTGQSPSMLGNVMGIGLPSYPYLNQMPPVQVNSMPNMMNSNMAVGGQAYYPVIPQNMVHASHQPVQQVHHMQQQPLEIQNPQMSLQNQNTTMQPQLNLHQPATLTSQSLNQAAAPINPPHHNMFDINAQKPPLPQSTLTLSSSPVDVPPFKKQKQNPAVTEDGEWTVNDNATLSKAVEECGENWDVISTKHFPSKIPQQVEQHWRLIQPRKGKWSKEEDRKMLEAYDMLKNEESPTITQTLFWYKVAAHIPGRSGQQCLARYSETLDPNVKYFILM
jgi:hypothetical protein